MLMENYGYLRYNKRKTNGKQVTALSIKPWEELTIADDYMFKLVMRRKHLCQRMLEKILRIGIRDIKYQEEEKTMKFGYDSKGIRLDLYLKADDTVIVVEMQVQNLTGTELAKRTRYYQSMIDLDLLKAGCKYRTLKESIVLFLCPFDPYGEGRHIYTFRNVCLENKSTEMGDQTTKIFLNAKGTQNDVSPDVKAFLDYVNGIVSEDAFVQELDAEIRKVKQIEEERMSYMTYELKLDDAREEGERRGREAGREEGENKLARLMELLLRDGKNSELKEVLSNQAMRKELYSQYGI